MKTRGLVAVLLLLTGFQSALAQKLKLYLSDKQVVEYSVEKVDSLVFTDGAGDTAETHEWVDLGLPSGTLWATCNVGANSPEEYGDYFAWGETQPKTTYHMSNYKYCKGTYLIMTKYCTSSSYGTVDNKTVLEPSDDAATVNWGSNWQMPSLEQCRELYNSSYTTTTWTTMNGKYGRKITSKSNGNSIFLPAAGYRFGTSPSSPCNAGSCGYYWSRSLCTSDSYFAYDLYFNSSGIDTNDDCRYDGRSVRPVRTTNSAQTTVQKIVLYMEGNQTIECNFSELDSIVFVDTEAEENDVHEYVDLGLPSGTLWATCNVGASKPEEYGDYFAWGETEPKNEYSWSTYKYCKGTDDTMTKYCTSSYDGTVDNKTVLEPSDDAATANWGSDWQMPSLEQCRELYNSSYTTTTWTTMNGKYGRKITSKSNGNSIFLPAAGYRSDASLSSAGSRGDYWSRSLNTSSSAYTLYFKSSDVSTNGYGRYYGQSVRPVRVNRVQTVAVSTIELSQSKLSVKVGETTQLSATVLPDNANNKDIKWESSNADVATVDQTGKVSAVAGGTCTITCSAADGSGVKAECIVTVTNPDNSGTLDGHDYVDLGLPSGTLWATCNVGASSPEEYGDYFAWGETTTKSAYSWNTYKYCKGSYDTMTKYCPVDNKTELEAVDDAATVNWGSEWQMPSYEQLDELINSSYTTTTWTTMNGKYGRKITSKSNGNSIFLPAAGFLYVRSLNSAGSGGYYWSRSLYTSTSPYYLNFDFSYMYTESVGRSYGGSVRPIRANRVQAITVSNIELSQTELSLWIGEATLLSATVLPDNATNKILKWASSNTDIATVDETGKITAVAVGTCTITCSATDGSGVKAECKVTVKNVNVSGSLNGHDYVDLGLPSGTLWATCNVGAYSPEEYGDYFAWGEIKPKNDYSCSTYKYGNGPAYTMTKYCTNSEYGTVDNKTELEAADDAATANWGSGWQMPSEEQCDELIKRNNSYTTWTWTTLNGKYGWKITSKSNGNSIFLPAAGWRDDDELISLTGAGSGGIYWSRSLNTSYSCYAYSLYFSSSSIGTSYDYRYFGRSVRPVRVKN